MYDPNKYKKSTARDDLGYAKSEKSTDMRDLRNKTKIICPTESPLKQWWLEQQEKKA